MDVSDTAGDTTITIRCLQGWKGAVTVSPSATLNGFLTALNTAADLRDGDVPSLHRGRPPVGLGAAVGAGVLGSGVW